MTLTNLKHILITTVFLTVVNIAKAQQYPDYIGQINDYEEVLDDKQEKALMKIINKTEVKSGSKILIVSTKDFKPAGGYKDYVIGLFTHWKWKEKDTRDGVLVIFSYNKRVLKIIPGKSVEHILNETRLNDIAENVITPKIINEKDFNGLKKGIKKISTYLIKYKNDKLE